MQKMQETQVWSLDWEDPLEEKMATHSNILVWRIPWTEEPGELQSIRWQRAGHDWSDLTRPHIAAADTVLTITRTSSFRPGHNPKRKLSNSPRLPCVLQPAKRGIKLSPKNCPLNWFTWRPRVTLTKIWPFPDWRKVRGERKGRKRGQGSSHKF